MGVCCVDGCEPSDSDNISYFPFPVKPALRRKWREAIKTTTKLHIDSKVCSRHFNTDDYEEVRGRMRLKGRVVPSLFNHTDGVVSRLRKRKELPKSPVPRKSPVPPKSTPPKSTPPKSPTPPADSIPTPPPEAPGESEMEEDHVIPGCVQTMIANGEDAENCTIECAPDGLLHEDSSSEPGDIHKEDIEDIIANYHIKQNKKLVDRLKASEEMEKREKVLDSDKDTQKSQTPDTTQIRKPTEVKPTERGGRGRLARSRGILGGVGGGTSQIGGVRGGIGEIGEVIEVEEDPGHTDPVYIEIPADGGKTSEGRDDCLMVLENVQVDIDPSALMLEAQDMNDKSDDPISLLTSSDEDDVIIQEPHIDTVEVSDETDEDDVPLVRLVKTEEKPESNLTKILWGNLYEYYCVQCNYTSTEYSEFKKHKLTHQQGKVLRMCEICNFTSASKTQFARHKKRHREEKRYKCNLCEYRAKHNMSLIYHMKSHQKEIRIETINLDKLPFKNNLNVKRIKYAFKCHACDFKSNARQEMLSHVRNCCDNKKYGCDSCEYKTNRRSDMKRHRQRKHNIEDDDDDEDYVPK